jgi:hypothetical protein
MIMGFIGRRLTGWRRTLVRAPILLYRAGLGRLLGHRFVYLVTRDDAVVCDARPFWSRAL